MGVEGYARLVKFLGAFVPGIMFFVCMGSTEWITTDTTHTGLWAKCVTNSSATQKCQSIGPGDSPAYFEVVRVLSSFVTVCYILFFFTCDENKGMGANKTPSYLSVTVVLLLTVLLVVMGVFYDDDDTWAEVGLQLDWSFYVAACADVMSFFTAVSNVYLYRLKTGKVNPSPNTNAKAKAKAKPKPKPKPQTEPISTESERTGQSGAELAGDNSLLRPTLQPKPQDNTGGKNTLSPIHPVPKPITEDPEGGDASQTDTAAQSLALPRYDLPVDHDTTELPPSPPDYHVTMEEEGREGAAAPQVTLPATSAWRPGNVIRTSVRFLGNYLRAGVGMKEKGQSLQSET